MKTLERELQLEPEVRGVQSPSANMIRDELHPKPLTFAERVERVADCLVRGCSLEHFTLDTKNNPVHAYVDAHYMPNDNIS